MAEYGLYSHIQSNRRRSLALLIGLFLLIYALVYAGALTAEAGFAKAGIRCPSRIKSGAGFFGIML